MMTAMKQNVRRTALLAFGTASALILLTSTQRSLEIYFLETSWPTTRFQTIAADAALWYFCALAVFPIYWIALRFPLERTKGYRLAILHLLLGFSFALINISVQSVFLSLLFGDPVGSLFQTSFIQKFFMRTSFYFLIAIACYAAISYQRHRDEELKAYRLESRLTFAQFQMLKSKLNPDFLFQTLRAISTWIRKDIEAADLLTARLGDFLRLSLEYSYAPRVTLQREIQLVKCYLDIRRIEGTSTDVSISMDAEIIDVLIPSGLLLRMAGSVNTVDPIYIRAFPNGKDVQISVTGLRKAPENLSESSDQVEWKFDGENLTLLLPITQDIEDSPHSEEGALGFESLDAFHRSIEEQEKRVRQTEHSRIKSFLGIFGLWTFVVLYFFTREMLMRTVSGEPLNILENVKDYVAWYWWALFTPLIFSLAKKYPIRQNLGRHLLFAAGISFLMVFLYYLQRWALGMPLEAGMLRQLLIGYSYGFDMLTYMAIVGVYEGLGYHRKYLREELRTARLRGNLMEAQLQALKMQLHPHFLFNTLNSISELMHEDPDGAERMLKRLEEFLRLTFQNSDIQEISLKEELEFLRNYLDIQQVRFQNRLRVDLKIDPQAMKDTVPNLILQPIVENAIRHGIAPRLDPGKIEIRASHKNGRLQLQVEDDGPGLPGGEYREGLGITNTRMRLEQLYGKECRFQMSNNPYGGLLVTLQIPVRSEILNRI
jgi:two-component system LytT family sensor kinase